MKMPLFSRTGIFLAFAAIVTGSQVSMASEDITETIGLVRSIYVADRQEFLAETMQLTEAEAEAFWPRYRQYSLQKEKIGDGLVKLVLEYADAYPNVPDERARQLLKDYSKLEKNLSKLREGFLRKTAKILPAAKALRFAQLENRLDLVLRLQLASKIPLIPVEGRLSGTSAGIVALAEGIPGGTIVQTYELTASVIATDKTSRKLTLLGENDIKQTFKAGPEVINFDQIKVGDQVKVRATEQLVVRIAEPGEEASTGAATLVALAPKGAKPGGLFAETVQLAATLTAIDLEAHTATLRFEDGSSRVFPVRLDVNLSKHKPGEKVFISATEKIAVSVQRP